MARRAVWMAGLAVAVSGLAGCHLFCDRYCERERDHCQQYNRGGCCAPAPVCAPGYTPPPPGGSYCQPQPVCCPP